MIETNRLILQPFRQEDATDVWEHLTEPMMNCFVCYNTKKDTLGGFL